MVGITLVLDTFCSSNKLEEGKATYEDVTLETALTCLVARYFE